MARNGAPQVDASSMADIAFLLLTFFLVATSLNKEEGLFAQLPALDPKQKPPVVDVNKRNVSQVVVNAYGQVQINGKDVSLTDITQITKDFINNNGRGTCTYCFGGKQDPTSSDDPNEAVVKLSFDENTSYKTYLNVYNEVYRAYHELRDVYAKKAYGKPYKELNATQQKDIDDKYPKKISEPDPIS